MPRTIESLHQIVEGLWPAAAREDGLKVDFQLRGWQDEDLYPNQSCRCVSLLHPLLERSVISWRSRHEASASSLRPPTAQETSSACSRARSPPSRLVADALPHSLAGNFELSTSPRSRAPPRRTTPRSSSSTRSSRPSSAARSASTRRRAPAASSTRSSSARRTASRCRPSSTRSTVCARSRPPSCTSGASPPFLTLASPSHPPETPFPDAPSLLRHAGSTATAISSFANSPWAGSSAACARRSRPRWPTRSRSTKSRACTSTRATTRAWLASCASLSTLPALLVDV